jgi:aminoglycoside phosphotransferase (APT) family kinase protein
LDDRDQTAVLDLLRRMALVETDEHPVIEPLAGGVSADIALARTRRGAVCVKRALGQLKVAQTWEASPRRNEAEQNWIRLVAGFLPQAVPAIVADLPEAHAFAMAYLDPAHFANWKGQLSSGTVSTAVAGRVGAVLGEVHRRTAGREDVARQFANDEDFADLRLRPYFEATARVHPDLAPVILALSERTAQTRAALVHGDYSPKNILIGPDGPVVLDAECAWYGDPAFDLAFCLTHLLLKTVWKPDFAAGFIAAAAALRDGHAETFAPAAPDWLDLHAATLVPALLLARVDGKSPVEYLGPAKRSRVRTFARHALAHPFATVPALFEAWQQEFLA